MNASPLLLAAALAVGPCASPPITPPPITPPLDPPRACGFDVQPAASAALVATYTLGPLSLGDLEPRLDPTTLDRALLRGIGTVSAPGIGSGLDWLADCSFVMVSDRGPNGSHDGGGKYFPLPEFAPLLARVHGAPTGELVVDQALALTDASGAPLSGLPNDGSEDRPYLTASGSDVAAVDPGGLDPEDVRRLPHGDLALVEEYGPSLLIVDGVTGAVRVRYTPAGVAPAAPYPVLPSLPAVLAERRNNKGFESLALSPDGETAYVVTQAPLGSESQTGDSRVARLLRLEHIADPTRLTVSGQYALLHAAAKTLGRKKQTDVYYNAATWLAPDVVLLLERADGGELQLVRADLTDATNLVGHPELGESSLALEEATDQAGLDRLGVTPAALTVVLQSTDVPALLHPTSGVAPDKIEGMAVLGPGLVALANDNDFGIFRADDASRIWLVRLTAALR